MADVEKGDELFNQQDHQVAFIFDPDEDGTETRPVKKRRMPKKVSSKVTEREETSMFTPLLNGTEYMVSVNLRQRLFETNWALVHDRIQHVLKGSNTAVLDRVVTFFTDAAPPAIEQLPSAFIITGPNIASQGLLFDQLSEALQGSSSARVVTLRSSEALTLKAILKKIIRDGTCAGAEEEEDELQAGARNEGRYHLDYDLEALHSHVATSGCGPIFVAFQDSEGFDSALLSDLIALLSSWRPKIPFSLLFGVATSIELLQARLLKSACRLVHGAQFDVVQADTILQDVFREAVAAQDVQLRIGPVVLAAMLERQVNHIAGVLAFVSSLKYAYMSHYFANALSVFGEADAEPIRLQPEHLEAVRQLPSFRAMAEQEIERGTPDVLRDARAVLIDDLRLQTTIVGSTTSKKEWVARALRRLLVLQVAGAWLESFSQTYVRIMKEGVSSLEISSFGDCVRRQEVPELVELLDGIIGVLRDGDATLRLGPAADDDLVETLERHTEALRALSSKAEAEGFTLRSKYSGQSKVMRTTVIAQRVQLSRDSAALRDEDNQASNIIDATIASLQTFLELPPMSSTLFSETWTYDSRSPSREVFIPKPRIVFQRGLTRCHDYLGCACCKSDDSASMPPTAILYRLYLETGSLINVADLWAAFQGIVAEKEEDERKVLFSFYRGLAELRALGYVKASRRKVDHVAKVRWL